MNENRMHERAKNSLATFIEVPFAYWRTILAFLIGSLALGWLTLLVLPRSYISEAKLMVVIGRESIALDPTVTTSETLLMQKTQEEEVNTTLEVIRSRKVAELVVKELGSDAILAGELPSADGAKSKTSVVDRIKNTIGSAVGAVKTVSGLSDAIGDHELAITSVTESLDVSAPIKSTAISVIASSKTPTMAQAIAQTTVDKFIERHRHVNRSDDSRDLFEAEVLNAKVQLKDAQEQKRNFLQENELVAIAETRMILKEQITAIDRDLIVAAASLEQSVAELDSLDDEIATQEDEIVASSSEASDPTWSGIRQRVYELELLEKSQSAIYKPGHKKLVRTQDQLAGARRILDDIKSQRVDQNKTPNPAKERLKDQRSLLVTKRAGLGSSIAKMKEQRQAVVKQIEDFLGHETEVERMDQQIGVLKDSLVALQTKSEEARVIERIQQETQPNIRVFQPATLIERAASPNKKIVAAAFAMLGIIGGLGLAFIRDFFSSRLRTAEKVQTRLNVPVLGQVMKNNRIGLRGDPVGKGCLQLQSECRAVVSRILHDKRAARNGQDYGSTVGIIAMNEGGGASTIAGAMAVASDRDFTLRTLLVDGDLKTKELSRRFELNGAPGLLELSQGQATLSDCIQTSKQADVEIVSSSSLGVRRRGGGDFTPNETASALEQMKSGRDLVIVDLPAAAQADQVIPIARSLDYVVLVLNSEKSKSTDTDVLLNCLLDCDTEVVGVVLNKCKNHVPKWISYFLAAN